MSPTLAFGDDGSAEADACWQWIDSHRWDGWRLEVVTADPRPDMRPATADAVDLQSWEPDRPRVPSNGGFVSVEHLQAEVDPRLALISREWDLLAIGPRGSGILKGFHLGSTADWLLREPTSPLLIARQPGPVRRVLYAADGSAHAVRALRTLAGLPWVEGVEVRVVAVDDGQSDVEMALREASEMLPSAAASMETVTVGGQAPKVIVGEIEETRPDLVVMGARGLKGLKGLVLGSTAAAVAGATDRSMLVAHARGDD